MKKILYFLALFSILPSLALAQTESAQGLIAKFLTFTNKTLIPFLLGIAFLLFTINTIRFFVIEGIEEEGRKNAKNLAFYSVLTFVALILFWAIVNLFAGSIGLNNESAPTPDYLEKRAVNLKDATAKPSSRTETQIINPDSRTPFPSDPCDAANGFDMNGNPCGIY